MKKKNKTCEQAFSGTEAIEILERITPRIILLDILLPDINGFEICKRIKSNSRTSDIKVYFISAIAEHEIKEKLSETGADGYFTKPFKMTDFNILLK